MGELVEMVSVFDEFRNYLIAQPCKLMKIYTIIYFNYINTTVLSLWNDFIYKENICFQVPVHGLSLQIKDVITVCVPFPLNTQNICDDELWRLSYFAFL